MHLLHEVLPNTALIMHLCPAITVQSHCLHSPSASGSGRGIPFSRWIWSRSPVSSFTCCGRWCWEPFVGGPQGWQRAMCDKLSLSLHACITHMWWITISIQHPTLNPGLGWLTELAGWAGLLAGMGWLAGLGWLQTAPKVVWLGWDGLAGLGWAGLAGLGWAGWAGLAGLGWVAKNH